MTYHMHALFGQMYAGIKWLTGASELIGLAFQCMGCFCLAIYVQYTVKTAMLFVILSILLLFILDIVASYQILNTYLS